MPLSIFWLFLISGLLLIWLKRRRTATTLFGIALIWLALISFAPLPTLLCGFLERSYPPFQDVGSLSKNSTIHILILGNGHTCDTVLPATNQLSHLALGRLVEGIRLHRLLPGSKLITSGWQGDDLVPNAQVLKNAAELLGVSPNDIIMLTKARNTEEEALFYKNTFGTNHQLIIVTDAIHMVRAMSWFRKANLNPTAAPTNHLIKRSPIQKSYNLLPSTYYIIEMELAIHEFIGIIWVKLFS